MDLRSGALYWPRTYSPPRLPVAAHSRTDVDALIIGAGVTGAFAAFLLSRAGARVAVLDSRRPATGSTAASTGLLQYEIDRPLTQLGRLMPPKDAASAYLASHRCLHDLAALCPSLGQVDLHARPSLNVARHADELPDLDREAEARRRLGIDVRLIDAAELREFGISRPGALLSSAAYEVNPPRLAHRLLLGAVEHGAVLLPRGRLDLACAVRSERPFLLEHPCGTQVRAAAMIIATGYETPEQFAEVSALTELRSTYAIATEPLPVEPWRHRALLWETGDPYTYARTASDGRVIVGGADEPFTTAAERDRQIEVKSEQLMAKLEALVPDLGVRPRYRWAGTFAQTADGLPFIGAHERWSDVYFALGYGGNGITFSLLAAQIIAAELTSQPDPRAALFRFSRPSARTGGQHTVVSSER